MRKRITEKDLDDRAAQLSELTGKTYIISAAYGGWELLYQPAGGTSTTSLTGFATKRELYQLIQIYISAYRAGQTSTEQS